MTLRLALLGHPVEHSLSPSLHGAAIRFSNLEGSYELIDVLGADLKSRIEALVKDRFRGFNITIPHKEAALSLCTRLTAEASLVQAVNCIRVEEDLSLTGHNTDMGGFIRSLKHAAGPLLYGSNALILGAGGAARACLAGLCLLNLDQVMVCARDISKAQALVRSMGTDSKSHCSALGYEDLGSKLRSDKHLIVINCTPIGLTEMNIPKWLDETLRLIKGRGFLFDTVYRKDLGDTILTKRATEYGVPALNGLEMLAEQAALSFVFWTGKEVSASILLQEISLVSNEP